MVLNKRVQALPNQGQAPALAQAGPNYDVAATSNLDYNYSSAEAVSSGFSICRCRTNIYIYTDNCTGQQLK